MFWMWKCIWYKQCFLPLSLFVVVLHLCAYHWARLLIYSEFYVCTTPNVCTLNIINNVECSCVVLVVESYSEDSEIRISHGIYEYIL